MEMTYYNTLLRPVPCWCVIVPYCIFYSVLSSVFLNILNISIISLREKSLFPTTFPIRNSSFFSLNFPFFIQVLPGDSHALGKETVYWYCFIPFLILALWKCIQRVLPWKAFQSRYTYFSLLTFNINCLTQIHFIAQIWNTLHVFDIHQHRQFWNLWILAFFSLCETYLLIPVWHIRMYNQVYYPGSKLTKSSLCGPLGLLPLNVSVTLLNSLASRISCFKIAQLNFNYKPHPYSPTPPKKKKQNQTTPLEISKASYGLKVISFVGLRLILCIELPLCCAVFLICKFWSPPHYSGIPVLQCPG